MTSADTKDAGHTPKPWEWSGLQLLGDCSDDSCSPVLIAQGDPFDPSEADKALIASAPELLEALKEIVQFNDACERDEGVGFDPQGPMMTKARAAISRAEGR